MISVTKSVSVVDLSPAEREELEAWLDSLDRGHYEDEAPGEFALDPTPKDREWWSVESGRMADPDCELTLLTARDWADVENCRLDAYADARDAGFDHIEATAAADAAEQRAIGERLAARAE